MVVGGGATALELISHGVLPGKPELDRLEGACSVSHQRIEFSTLGPATSGRFFSYHRRRSVGYTLAFPPRKGPGSGLPLVVMLHGFGANHTSALAGGNDDPFYPGVEAFTAALGPTNSVVEITNGCHTAPFFVSQEPPSLTFLAGHLGAPG